jgi:hypothetical protein
VQLISLGITDYSDTEARWLERRSVQRIRASMKLTPNPHGFWALLPVR